MIPNIMVTIKIIGIRRWQIRQQRGGLSAVDSVIWQ